jgi:hypothetical protein
MAVNESYEFRRRFGSRPEIQTSVPRELDPTFVCLELSEDSTRKFGISCRRDYGADDGIGGDKSD